MDGSASEASHLPLQSMMRKRRGGAGGAKVSSEDKSSDSKTSFAPAAGKSAAPTSTATSNGNAATTYVWLQCIVSSLSQSSNELHTHTVNLDNGALSVN